MAVLDSTQLAALRRWSAKEGIEISYVKGQANLAFQAIEDWFNSVAVQNSLSTAIDDATTHSFTAAQKKKFGKSWMRQRWGRD